MPYFPAPSNGTPLLKTFRDVTKANLGQFGMFGVQSGAWFFSEALGSIDMMAQASTDLRFNKLQL